jgi:hypothetical protein
MPRTIKTTSTCLVVLTQAGPIERHGNVIPRIEIHIPRVENSTRPLVRPRINPLANTIKAYIPQISGYISG